MTELTPKADVFDTYPPSVASVLRYIASYRLAPKTQSEKKIVAAMHNDSVDRSDPYFAKFTPDERDLAFKVEGMRAAMAAKGDQKLISYGAGVFAVGPDGKPLPGRKADEDLAYQSNIGSKPNKGVLMKRIAEAYGAKRILELGTNTGLGSCYLCSATTAEKLVSIEGAPDLSVIARHNLAQVSDKVTVINGFFSDVIEDLIRSGEPKFDMVFIDGQHERKATLAYMEMVSPLMADDSIFLFDDIYWSPDMNNAWKDVQALNRFAYVFEADSMGVAVQVVGDTSNKRLDVSTVVPPREISKKRLHVLDEPSTGGGERKGRGIFSKLWLRLFR